jgi:hypothetical protein
VPKTGTLLICFAGNQEILQTYSIYPCQKVVLLYTFRDIDRYHELRHAGKLLGIEIEGHEYEEDYSKLGGAIDTAMKGDWKLVVINLEGVGSTIMVAMLTMLSAIRDKCLLVGKDGGELKQLPMVSFKMEEFISESKFKLIEAIHKNPGCNLAGLSEATGMDKSLISYHINGGKEKRGLRDLGVVATKKGHKGSVILSLTDWGDLLLNSYRVTSEEGKAILTSVQKGGRRKKEPSPKGKTKQISKTNSIFEGKDKEEEIKKEDLNINDLIKKTIDKFASNRPNIYVGDVVDYIIEHHPHLKDQRDTLKVEVWKQLGKLHKNGKLTKEREGRKHRYSAK